jgi:TatA/E family protein of Tat protein translocase
MLALISDTGIIILVAAFVMLFGASQIPKLARNVAEAGKEFRKAHNEIEDARPAPSPAPPVPSLASSDDRVTLTKAELDALLSSRSGPASENPS